MIIPRHTEKFKLPDNILVCRIFHFRKYLSESQIAEYFFEVFASDVMTYDNVLFSVYDLGMRSSRNAVSPVDQLC